VNLAGVSMNDHFIYGSDKYEVGLIDSGTTFTFVPEQLFLQISVHFDWFCSIDHFNNCKGTKLNANNRPCFKHLVK